MKKLLAGIICIVIAAGTVQAESDREIAAVYFRMALELFSEKDPGAGALLEKAFEFDSETADLYYLESLILNRQGADLHKVLESLEKAMSLKGFQHYTLTAIQRDYMKALYRTKQYSQCLLFRNELLTELEEESDILYLLADSAYRTHKKKLSWELAERGSGFYPHDIRFYILMFLTGQNEYSMTEVMKHYQASDYVYIVKSLERIPLGPVRDNFFEYVLLQSPQEIKTLLLKEELTVYEAVILNRKGFSFDFLLGHFSQFLIDENFTGTLLLDRNGDHYNEDTVILSRGNIEKRTIDMNQDRVTDVNILFKEGVPVVSEIDGYSYTYSDYPLVSEVAVMRGESTIHYYLHPGVYEMASPPYNGEMLPVNGLKDFLPLVYKAEEREKGKVFREWIYLKGELLYMKEDTRKQGIMDHVLKFNRYGITAGKRDFDYDGEYETYEVYKDGEWKGIAFSSDEYKNFYFADWSVMDLRVWDYNNDRSIDDSVLITPEDVILGKRFKNVIIKREDLLNWSEIDELWWQE